MNKLKSLILMGFIDFIDHSSQSLDLQLPRETTNKLRLYWHCLIAGENYTPVIESVKIEGE